MNCYRPARQYLPASLVAFALALFSVWCGTQWALAYIPAGLFVLSALLLVYLGTRPEIAVGEAELRVGAHRIRWRDVAQIDSTVWTSPLVLHIRLTDGRRLRVIYPGDEESAGRLLRQMRRSARGALIDGLPYRQYWGEVLTAPDDLGALASATTYRLLRPEDEEEIERLFQKLKSVGRLDKTSSSDEREE
jgi:hypothetical protein